MALGGYNVVCCTTSKERFDDLAQELSSIQQQQHEELVGSPAKVGVLSRASSLEEGARFKLWAVGKYDTSVRQEDIKSVPGRGTSRAMHCSLG